MKQFDMCFNYLNNLSYIVQKLQLHVYEELYDEISTKFRHWINVRRHWIDVETMSEFNVESTSEFQRPFNFHIQRNFNVISTLKGDVVSTLKQRWNACWGSNVFTRFFFIWTYLFHNDWQASSYINVFRVLMFYAMWPLMWEDNAKGSIANNKRIDL